jgi:hypothetical protein
MAREASDHKSERTGWASSIRGSYPPVMTAAQPVTPAARVGHGLGKIASHGVAAADTGDPVGADARTGAGDHEESDKRFDHRSVSCAPFLADRSGALPVLAPSDRRPRLTSRRTRMAWWF